MNDFITYLLQFVYNFKETGSIIIVQRIMPLFLLFELPFFIIITLGAIRFSLRKSFEEKKEVHWYPKVSVIITCYAEGEAVYTTLYSLFHQEYPGVIEVIPVVDGSKQNDITFKTVLSGKQLYRLDPERELLIVNKKFRVGR